MNKLPIDLPRDWIPLFGVSARPGIFSAPLAEPAWLSGYKLFGHWPPHVIVAPPTREFPES